MEYFFSTGINNIIKYEDCLKYFDKKGLIIKWYSKEETDANGGYGYGFISDDNNQEEFFAHYSKHSGLKKTDENFSFNSYKCLFLTGYEPRKSNKISTLSFVLESDLEKPIENFYEERREFLSQLKVEELIELLEAKWYLNIWAKFDNLPKLNPDFLLFDVIKNRISNDILSLENKESIFEALEKTIYEIPFNLSPYKDNFHFDKELKKSLEKGIFDYSNESEWFKSLEKSSNNKFINNWLNEITLGFDIEADENFIFESGFYGNLISSQSINKDATIDKIFKYLGENHYWLIGHNIIGWDIPRIQHENYEIQVSKIIWDTLFISWLLKPWEKTHALTTSVKAHDAVEDSKAALELFYQQIKLFDSHLIIQYDNNNLSFPERLRLIGQYLFNIPYSFLSVPSWLTKENKIYVIPDFLIDEVVWIPEITFFWPKGYSSVNDMYIDLEKLEEIIRENSENIYLNLLGEVIKKANKQQVHVIVRMIPLWIRENIEDYLSLIIDNKTSQKGRYNIITYKALRDTLSPNEIQKFISKDNIICAAEGFEELIDNPTSLDTQRIIQLKEQFPKNKKLKLLENYPTSGVMVRIDDNPLKEGDLELIRWLEFVPSFRMETAFTPFRLFNYYKYNISKVNVTSSNGKFIIPRWVDDTNLKSDQVFLTPVSGNRKNYWKDVLSRLYSIVNHNVVEDRKYIFLVEFSNELNVIKNILCELDLTIDSTKKSILRRVEETFIKKSNKIFISTIENANIILNACNEFNLACQFIIETAPINRWQIYYYNNDNNNKDIHNLDLFDEDENVEDLYESEDDEEENKKFSSTKLFYPDLNSWGEFLEERLKCWYVELFSTKIDVVEPILLDARLSQDYINKNSSIIFKNFIYYEENEGINKTFEKYKNNFSDVDRLTPPIIYEEYRKFLHRNWDYPDFKRNSKRTNKSYNP